MSLLSPLIAGSPRGAGHLASSLRHLGETVSTLEGAIRSRRPRSRPADRLVTPFLIRSLMEVSCTALIGRIDPFRLLTLRELQAQGVRLGQ